MCKTRVRCVKRPIIHGRYLKVNHELNRSVKQTNIVVALLRSVFNYNKDMRTLTATILNLFVFILGSLVILLCAAFIGYLFKGSSSSGNPITDFQPLIQGGIWGIFLGPITLLLTIPLAKTITKQVTVTETLQPIYIALTLYLLPLPFFLLFSLT